MLAHIRPLRIKANSVSRRTAAWPGLSRHVASAMARWPAVRHGELIACQWRDCFLHRESRPPFARAAEPIRGRWERFRFRGGCV